jgi:hypothetical protein
MVNPAKLVKSEKTLSWIQQAKRDGLADAGIVASSSATGKKAVAATVGDVVASTSLGSAAHPLSKRPPMPLPKPKPKPNLTVRIEHPPIYEVPRPQYTPKETGRKNAQIATARRVANAELEQLKAERSVVATKLKVLKSARRTTPEEERKIAKLTQRSSDLNVLIRGLT